MVRLIVGSCGMFKMTPVWRVDWDWCVLYVKKCDFLGCEKDSKNSPGPSVETCQSMPSNPMSQITRKFHLMQICDVAYSECNNAVAYDPYLNQYAACQKMRRMHEGTPVGGVGGGKFGWCFLLFERNRYKAFQGVPEVKSFSNKKMLSFKGCILQQELLGRLWYVVVCFQGVLVKL